jgi:bifunctional DNA-binding transcriptional regulator/antitoxin component of YhaV-PrlF toxin-antitoxin module
MIAELRAKAQITVPHEIVSQLGLNRGDKFEISIQDGAIFMLPVAVYPKSYITELEARAHEARTQLANGDLEIYDDADTLISALHAASNIE